jgi:hypothetical protein
MRFRRDGLLPTNPSYVARTVTVSVAFGEGTITAVSPHFDANYWPGTKTTVISSKTINLSGWEAAPAIAPAAGGDTWPFDVVHSYGGKAATGRDLTWEVQVHSNTQAGMPYPMDADIVTPSEVVQVGDHVGFGGCAGIAVSSTFTNHATKFSWAMGVRGAAAGVPAYAMIGGPASIQVPGWCGPFETSLFLFLPLGATDLTGAVTVNIDPITYTPAAIGGRLEIQALTFQSGLPETVGIGSTNSQLIPMDPPTTPACKHQWAPDADDHHATSGVRDGGIILFTNHV